VATLLVRHADVLVTMDDARREIADGGVFARDGVIEAVGPSDKLPTDADEVIDARGQLVMPRLVNTHYHMFQTLTRALPAAQDAELFAWLRALYPIWAGLTPEMLHTSTQTPFSVSRDLMRESAALARQYGVSLHTHLAENDNDIAYSREKFSCTPAEYAEALGWVGRDVWCAHCVKRRRRRHPLVRPHRHRRGALPVLEHAAGVGYRAGSQDARCRRAGGDCGGRIGVERFESHVRRAAHGDAAAARGAWPGGADRARRAGDGHTRRRPGAEPR
jgi:cytosine/adenosine deaminase-related metal-dependent hydrolase